MSLPYRSEGPPDNWEGWKKLSESEKYNLTKQEKDKLFEELIKYQQESFIQVVMATIRSSPQYVAVCVITGGSGHGYVFQTELIQLKEGDFLIQTWDDLHSKASEIYSVNLNLDLRQELKNLRREGFNLRGSENKNPDLETGLEGRYSSLYIAVKEDIDWVSCPQPFGTGTHKNNAVNRIFSALMGKRGGIKLVDG